MRNRNQSRQWLRMARRQVRAARHFIRAAADQTAGTPVRVAARVNIAYAINVGSGPGRRSVSASQRITVRQSREGTTEYLVEETRRE